MTSQGTGEPFTPGEKIMGYQACHLKGSCYIDVDSQYSYKEKLTNISPDDEVLFRYVKSDSPWTGIQLECSGSGRIMVLLDGKKAGNIEIRGEEGKLQTTTAFIKAEAGEYTLALSFDSSEGMELYSVTLFS